MVPNLGIMFDNLKEEKKKLYDENKVRYLCCNGTPARVDSS